MSESDARCSEPNNPVGYTGRFADADDDDAAVAAAAAPAALAAAVVVQEGDAFSGLLGMLASARRRALVPLP